MRLGTQIHMTKPRTGSCLRAFKDKIQALEPIATEIATLNEQYALFAAGKELFRVDNCAKQGNGTTDFVEKRNSTKQIRCAMLWKDKEPHHACEECGVCDSTSLHYQTQSLHKTSHCEQRAPHPMQKMEHVLELSKLWARCSRLKMCEKMTDRRHRSLESGEYEWIQSHTKHTFNAELKVLQALVNVFGWVRRDTSHTRMRWSPMGLARCL